MASNLPNKHFEAAASFHINSGIGESELAGIASLAKQYSVMNSVEAKLKSLGDLGVFNSVTRECEALRYGMIGNLTDRLGVTESSRVNSTFKEFELAAITVLVKESTSMIAAEANRKKFGVFDSLAKECEALQQSTIDNLTNRFGTTAPSHINSIFSEYELIGMTSLARQFSAMKLAEASLKNVGILGVLDPLAKRCETLQQDIIGNLTNSFGTTASSHLSSIFRENELTSISSLTKHFSAMNSAEAILKKSNGLGALDSFAKQYESMLKTAAAITKSINLTEYKTNINSVYFPSNELYEIDEQEIHQKLEGIADAQDCESLIERLKAIPPWLQCVLFIVFTYVIVPTISSIIDSYVKQYVECHLPWISCSSSGSDSRNHNHSNRDEIKFIKSLSFEDFDYINSRFVSTDYLNIYSKPNQKTQILDELTLGKIVILVEKERNWAKVAYRDDNGKICQGWVHNRYLKKFGK
ncbi:MAG: SH3 domain-containing protein [Nitrosomonas oligotropha]|uniref:SH3 domain-containing protein n=1 Tax=Nitrosomonas oligotropha TaxID=42354 RepID=A0A5C7VPZ9_9PROT|nr:MAG: SH3 domain-containing protein [Nitrosomonas oligotropha]